MSAEVLWVGNDVLLRLTGVRGAANNAYVNGASANVTLIDAVAETEIAGQSWPLTIPYVADSDGQYEVVLPDSLVIEDGQLLRAEIVVDGGDDLRLFVKLPIFASDRTGTSLSASG